MPTKLQKLIASNPDIFTKKGADDSQIATLQQKLISHHYPPLPMDFFHIITLYNGIYNDGAQFYGFDETKSPILDIISVNNEMDWDIGANAVIIGEDESDWLLYDGDEKVYKIIDKEDETEWHHSSQLENLLIILLKI